MRDILIIPGQRFGVGLAAEEAMEDLHETYLEYYHSNCGPFKMLRCDRYFLQIENYLPMFLRPPKGGKKWDNRRRGLPLEQEEA